MITALYPFDQNINDLNGYNIGIFYGASVLSFSTTLSYVRQSINIDASLNQYIRISNINFRQQSFTIQLWFFIRNGATATEYGLFSQCDSDSICLLLSIRNYRTMLTFDSMNVNAFILKGTTTISVNTLYHITVVYDMTARQQSIYVNGRIDAISSGTIEPFQGSPMNTNTFIALTVSYNDTISYFDGY